MAYLHGTFSVTQTILPGHVDGITARSVYENDLSPAMLKRFLSSCVDGRIGLAPAYDAQQVLTSIAFASQSQVLIVKFVKPAKLAKSHKSRLVIQNPRHELLKTSILSNTSFTKYAFHMDKLCTSLFYDLSLYIIQAVDILSCFQQPRHLLKSKVLALGGEPRVNAQNVRRLFRMEESSNAEPSTMAIQAWAARQASQIQPMNPIRYINTTALSDRELGFLAKTIRNAEQLKALKPDATRNDIEGQYKIEKNGVTLQSSRFKTRIMPLGSNQILKVEGTQNGKQTTYSGRLNHCQGRTAQLNVRVTPQVQNLTVHTIGRDDPTAAEALRTGVLLEAIQGASTFLNLPFVKDIWFSEKAEPLSGAIFSKPVPIDFDARPLNTSQIKAVEAILSNKPSQQMVLIQGPPGTGKTTVIAAAVTSIIASLDPQRTVWLVAHSNVAVKNMAEKLADVGFFDFKLLVSKDFHFDWHEHLYEKIHRNVIRSDDFVPFALAAERLLAGSRVILCTLSMLSNDRISVFARLVPPTLFIFDEASQIEIGDYVPMLHRYQSTMRKLVFIGDDKQLPPYGQSDTVDLQSVFEIPHLRGKALFLDTQYRMPHAIGNIISQKVYNNRLRTVHSIKTSCCRFVDVSHGQEKSRGRSWVNEEQARIVVILAAKMQKLGYKYRVITPYDAQRSLLENSLKGDGLHWEDKVFNVDSFQGNEDDYIIISLVRTDKIGFLREQRRVNVMLTRCKKGLIVCTNRGFINGPASGSLAGALARGLGSGVWVDWKSVLQPDFQPFP